MVTIFMLGLLALSAAGSWAQVWLTLRNEKAPAEAKKETREITEEEEEDRMRVGFLNLMCYGLEDNKEERE